MKKRALTRREKALLIILGILIAAAAYYMFVHRVVVDSLARIEGEKQDVETAITIDTAKVVKLTAMKKELEEIEEYGVKSVVPEYDNLSREIVFLNKVLEGTSDYTINFSSLTTTQGIARRVANLEFTTSSYDNSCKIIDQLQNCEYCCRLGDVIMEPIDEYNGTYYSSLYGYGYYDADYSILRNPLTVKVSMTFYEKMDEASEAVAVQ